MREDGKKKLEEDRKRVRREKILLDKAQREMDVQKGKNLQIMDTYFYKVDRIPCLEKLAKRKSLYISLSNTFLTNIYFHQSCIDENV